MQLMEKLKNHFSCASDYFACISKDYFVPTRTADGVCRVIHFRGVKIIELDYLQFYITDSLEFILVAQLENVVTNTTDVFLITENLNEVVNKLYSLKPLLQDINVHHIMEEILKEIIRIFTFGEEKRVIDLLKERGLNIIEAKELKEEESKTVSNSEEFFSLRRETFLYRTLLAAAIKQYGNDNALKISLDLYDRLKVEPYYIELERGDNISLILRLKE